MFQKNKLGELDALATITIRRIMIQITDNMPKNKLIEPDKIDSLVRKWNPQLKELLLQIHEDFENLRNHASSKLRM